MGWSDAALAFKELAQKFGDAQSALDLQAQLVMAYWARWSAVATFIGLAVSALALYGAWRSLRLTREALRLTREANAIATKASEMQTQAYVHAASARFGINNNILINCKNSGITPATHISLNGTAKLVRKGRVTASIEFATGGFKTWSALGANEEASVSFLEQNQIVKQFADLAGEYEVLLISGQIIYCTVFNHDHLTQFAFYVEPDTSKRFRRPTANLITFHRLNGKMATTVDPVEVILDDNEG